MNKRLTVILFLTVLWTVFPGKATYEIGDIVSDFTLPDRYENNVNLYDFQGDVILIAFWSNG